MVLVEHRRAHVGANLQRIGPDLESLAVKLDRVVVVLLVEIHIRQLDDGIEIFGVLFDLGGEFFHLVHVDRRRRGLVRVVRR